MFFVATILLLSICNTQAEAKNSCVELFDQVNSKNSPELTHFFTPSINLKMEKKIFLTYLQQLGIPYEKNGNHLILKFTDPSKSSLLHLSVAEMIAKNGLEDIALLNRKLQHILPDPGKIEFADWFSTKDGIFKGSIDSLMEKEAFRSILRSNNHSTVALPFHSANELRNQGRAHANANWDLIARISGKDSRDTVAKRFPGSRTEREIYWPTDFIEDALPFLDPYKVRVAVNVIDGVEREAEVFVSQNDVWYALVYERKNGKWSRKPADSNGEDPPIGCIQCHGFGDTFGPTPKLKDYRRPKGWFEYSRNLLQSDSSGVPQPVSKKIRVLSAGLSPEVDALDNRKAFLLDRLEHQKAIK